MEIESAWAARRHGGAELAAGLVKVTLLIDSGPL